ncbi:MAG: PLP-dependent aminotransferase family protein [Actinobacteria bacterium]|nr:PLP-dependent aminotransferase family protein [Actinomycetota bacterium]
MTSGPSHTQNTLRRGIIELAFGEPDPALLAVGLVRRAATAALDDAGPAMLAYGAPAGPPALRREIARRVAARESCACTAADVLVSGGNSQALGQVLTMLTAPGDVVLVEAPTYNLALGIMRDHPVEVVGVPLDDEGIRLDELQTVLGVLRAGGRRARLLYTIPTFHNPAGVCLSSQRRQDLLEIATEHGLVLVEDDVYRELVYDGAAPPALWALGGGAPVVRLGSFSKTLAPGLRVGWINASAGLLERLAASGVLTSGGCVSQFGAGVVGRLLAADGYDQHLAVLRRTYASRRDALAEALREHLPAGCSFATPAGGFFIWPTLPAGLAATALLPLAEARGVAFAPGARFCTDGDDRSLRLSFSLYDEATLREGARRLGAAVADAQAGRA